MTKHILLVDDFLIANEIVKNELIKAGFAVVITVDPKKVLKILESQTIDLIVTDYNMPQMNGIELLKAVRAIPAYHTLPIIILSGVRNDIIKQHAFDEKVTAWINKPFTSDKVIHIIKTLLD